MWKHTLRKRLYCLTLLGTLWAAGSAGAQELIIAPGEPIPLAIISNRQGAAFGEGHISERGVLLAGEDRPALTIDGQEFVIELLDGDSACDAETAAAVAESFVANGRAIAIIGPNCSSACLATAPLFDAAGFTSLSPTCTAPTLTEQGFTSFHRLVSTDALTAERAARFLYEELGGRRLALLYTSDENPTFYEGQAEVVAADFAALGGEIVSEITLTAATDYAALMSEIEAAAPDQLFCTCEPEAASALLAALAESDLSTIPLLGAELNWADQLLDLAGAAADGIYVISGAAEPSEASANLAARYEERFGDAPHSPYYSNAYDAYQLLLDAVQAVGVLDDEGNLRIDRAALQAEIRNTSDYAGVTGTIRCDETGECLRSPTSVYQIQDGALVTLLTYED